MQPNPPTVPAASASRPIPATMSKVDYYIACMVLGAAGDALAFWGGDWEFQRDGSLIHKAIEEMGGLSALNVKDHPVSDDTVMHLATAEGLVHAAKPNDKDSICWEISRYYVSCMEDMNGRAPGITCIRGAKRLKQNTEGDYTIPFDRAGGGCGGAMRSMCIGLRFPHEDQEDMLIAVAIESGRMTHNHPTGYLGSLASALFTAYAIRRTSEPKDWGRKLVTEVLPKALEYVKNSGHGYEEAQQHWDYFKDKWVDYLKERRIYDGKGGPHFPDHFGVAQRDEFYRSISWDGWGGSSGHDAPMIAYDALLGAKGSWEELMNRGFFHGGDSDSTAIIAACWHGAYYAYRSASTSGSVPGQHYQEVEKSQALVKVAKDLYKMAFPADQGRS